MFDVGRSCGAIEGLGWAVVPFSDSSGVAKPVELELEDRGLLIMDRLGFAGSGHFSV